MGETLQTLLDDALDCAVRNGYEEWLHASTLIEVAEDLIDQDETFAPYDRNPMALFPAIEDWRRRHPRKAPES